MFGSVFLFGDPAAAPWRLSLATEVNIGLVGARIEQVVQHFGDMSAELERATEVLYEHTRQRFEDWGGGEWEPLAESTVARKTSQGYAEPDRPLFATGNLFESVTSPNGPYSYRIIDQHVAVVGVDWDVGGVQIAPLLSAGNPDTNLPSRPIWPHDQALVDGIEAALRGKDTVF